MFGFVTNKSKNMFGFVTKKLKNMFGFVTNLSKFVSYFNIIICLKGN